jgi:hypothetical protein
MIDAAIYWTGAIVLICVVLLGLCALVRFTLNRMIQAVRAAYSFDYLSDALKHYKTIKPYKIEGKEW